MYNKEITIKEGGKTYTVVTVITNSKKNETKQVWRWNGVTHRERGPAVIHSNGNRWWYKHGKSHREDGPAIIYADGNNVLINKYGKYQWKLHGSTYSKESFLKLLKYKIIILNGELYLKDGRKIKNLD